MGRFHSRTGLKRPLPPDLGAMQGARAKSSLEVAQWSRAKLGQRAMHGREAVAEGSEPIAKAAQAFFKPRNSIFRKECGP